MNSGQEISRQLVVAGSYPPEIFEPAERALDDVSPFVCPLVEAMDDDAVGFIGNYGLGAALDDVGAEPVCVIAFVGEEGAHGGRERQNIGGGSDVGLLARGQMKDNRPAERIAQRMDFCRATATRAADGLGVLPPFPPEAQR
jgi:hypothetical protein